MAGRFDIEWLEPRQLLSSSAAPSATPIPSAVAAAGAVTVVTASAASASAAAADIALATTASTDAAATATAPPPDPAFVRPGDNGASDNAPQGSRFGWGTDIYPPPIFVSSPPPSTTGPTAVTTTGPTASDTTPTTATTTPGTVVSPPRIVIARPAHGHGHRQGISHVTKHFSVRPDDVESHPGHAGSGSGSTTSATPPNVTAPGPNAARVFHAAGSSALIIAPTSLTAGQTRAEHTNLASSSAATALQGLTFSPIGPGCSSAPVAPASAAPDPAASIAFTASPVPGSADRPAAASGATRFLRALSPLAPLAPLAPVDLAGVLLPLATMDESISSTAGHGIGAWEFDVALGSLTVVIAGYLYLSDTAARRRREQNLTASLFSEMPME